MRELEDFVSEFAIQQGLENNDKARTLIVIEELLINLSRYGYLRRPERGGVAEVTLELEDNRLTIEFGDDGDEFDPLAIVATNLEQTIESRPIGGLGLHIIRQLVESAQYSRLEGRNVIRLSRQVVLINGRRSQ